MRYLNEGEILQCPNKCGARLTTSAHVSQTWYVDEHGRFEETLTECGDVVSESGEYECSGCGDYAQPFKKED